MSNAVQARAARAIGPVALAATLLALSPVDALAAKSGGPVATIAFQAAGGSGCKGTSSVKPSWDRAKDRLTLLYDDMMAVDPTAATKSRDCTITLEVSYPENYQFAVTNTVFHGYYSLSKGARAEVSAKVQWQSDEEQVLQTTYFDKPETRDFTFDKPVKEIRYSDCGTPTILVLSMRILATKADDGSEALIAMNYSDTTTGTPLPGKPQEQSFEFISQSC
jgi:Domain of unknown function (DUF4360)